MKIKTIVLLILFVFVHTSLADGEALPGIPDNLQYQMDGCVEHYSIPDNHNVVGVTNFGLYDAKDADFILEREYGDAKAFTYVSTNKLNKIHICKKNQREYEKSYRLNGCYDYLLFSEEYKNYSLVGGFNYGKYGGYDSLLVKTEFDGIDVYLVLSWHDFEHVEICY